MSDLLQVDSVDQFYGESHTLWSVDLRVPVGGCLCLMGRNGVGKTTLLKAIMGLLPVRDGRIRFHGEDLTGRPAEQRARSGIGYVPQGREIFPQLTVEENLRIGLRGAGEIPGRIFELFPVLRRMLQRRGGDLSGGQQQQLAIGRALALDPSLLIFDEPTEGIQPNVVREIGDVIRHLNRDEGMTILLVEQKLPFARRVAETYSIMDKGRMVANGDMDALDETTVQDYLTV